MLLAGMVVLVVIFLVANRRSKTAQMSRSNRGAVSKWNGYAIAAFVGSFFVPLIPMLLAVLALVQISKSRQRGRVLAIAALVVQVLLLIGFVALVPRS